MDTVLDSVHSATDLSKLINHSIDQRNICNLDTSSILSHKECFDAAPREGENTPLAYCPYGLLNLLIECITMKPNYIDDDVKDSLSDYFKQRNIEVMHLMDREVLISLHTRSTSRTLTWLKFEGVLKKLIKDCVYLPKNMADEVLRTVKHELDPTLGASLASTLGSCVKTCREINQKHASGEEEEEKWCEIIDWMSWFLSNNEDDNLECF